MQLVDGELRQCYKMAAPRNGALYCEKACGFFCDLLYITTVKLDHIWIWQI